ncbi:MAG: lysine--tRNA ligase [Myxococcales bacterium]|nr:lysine--tRNA ligase [Myxococcales bacterium]
MATEDELRAARHAKAEALLEAGTLPFPNDLRIDEPTEARRRALLALAADEAAVAALPEESELPEDAERWELYGRVMAKRGPFLVIRTPYGDGQALVRKEALSEQDAAQLARLDLADHVWVRGPAIRTRTGQLALRGEDYRHVTKALLPPPAKWHGLKDVEKRYRERYVDLFANPQVAAVFRARAEIVSALRRFLDARGFLEVETPTLHSVRGGATAKPFDTHHNALDLDLFLRIAPELYLKRLLVGGFDRVYEIARCFRNEGISARHNPEFSMVELYQAYASHEELMDLVEGLLRSIDTALEPRRDSLGPAAAIEARDFDLSAPWARIPMRRAILDRLERAGEGEIPECAWTAIDASTLDDPSRLEAAIEARLETLEPPDRKLLASCANHGERIFALYELLAEPELTRLYRTADGRRSVPVFITEYPFEVSPLARKNDADPRWVDRFEIFIDGREMGNGFSELNDPLDQAERFEAQLQARARGAEETMDFDADYVRALSHGMPPAAGFGLGVDRLVMLLCGQPSIRDVLLFPLLRPEA